MYRKWNSKIWKPKFLECSSNSTKYCKSFVVWQIPEWLCYLVTPICPYSNVILRTFLCWGWKALTWDWTDRRIPCRQWVSISSCSLCPKCPRITQVKFVFSVSMIRQAALTDKIMSHVSFIQDSDGNGILSKWFFKTKLN